MTIIRRGTVRAFILLIVGVSVTFAAGLPLPAHAAVDGRDARPLSLAHLSTADGLPQATVMATLQDSQGFVWFATEDGLVRYDGHELIRYGHARNGGDTLPGNFVRDLAEDGAGDLWIAVKDSGLARWSRATDRFRVYRHDAADPHSLPSNAVRSVLVDRRGKIWVGTADAGVGVLDPATGSFQRLRHDAAAPGSLSDDRVNVVEMDRAGNVWVGTDAGLNRWQPESGTFAHVRHVAGDATTIGSDDVSQFLEDSAGRIWVGTLDGGLYQIDWQGRALRAFRHDPKRGDSLAHDDVRALLEDRSGRLWVGTADGLCLLDRQNGNFTIYRHDRAGNESLPDSFVMSLYEDGAGLVWIGTRTGGVSRWNPAAWELGGHRPEWLNGRMVTAFAEANGHRVWIGSLGGGLVRFDRDTGEATPIDAIVGRRDAIADSRVMSLRNDRQGTLWIGTMSHGVKALRPDGRIDSIPVGAGKAGATSAPGIMSLYEARNGMLWIGTYGGGANVLDPATGDVRQLAFGRGAGVVSHANVSGFAEDAVGNLWIATDGGGLNLARPDGTVIRTFHHDPADATSLSSDSLYALAVDAAGQLWVATDDSGIDLVVGSSSRPDEIRFRNYSRSEGLSSDTVYGIVPEPEGHLWLSGNAGLMHFDPKTGQVKTYHREHGLQGEEFNFGAFHALRDGRVAFGGPGGFNVFDPAHVGGAGRAPRLALTRVEVMGAPLTTVRPWWLTNSISLPHDATVVSLDVAVLDFQSPGRNRLAYRVPGLVDRWIDLGAQHRVTLTNLAAGTHVLEVRGANADSMWADAPLKISIVKAASPWATPWAYGAYALLVVALIAMRTLAQRRALRRAADRQVVLEQQVASRTEQLVESNRRLADAARAKEGFLARMSHELRTPMNGVVGMTELLSRTPLSASQAQLTNTIRGSAESLLRILNDLLDLSKIDAGRIELETLPVDLTQLVEDCAALFAGACDGKGIELVVSPPDRRDLQVLGDPLRMRQILTNLIGNAVKFTERGEIAVKADVLVDAPGRAEVRLTVADTGIGMEPAVAARVFEPFAQADESTSRRFGGTGLGLAICRELASLMGGTIRVESRPHVGSTFVVSIPLAVAPAPDVTLPHSLDGRYARILTRRPALRESLERYLAALGVTALAPSTTAVEATPPGTLLLIDADSQAGDAVAAARGTGRPGVLLATAAAVRDLALEETESRATIVRKPVQLAALRAALEAEVGAGPATTTSTVATDAPRGHVLVVEDDDVNATVAQGYLEALGLSSVRVADGASAVSRTAAEHFDLVLMDINMPGLDGLEAAALIRERERGGHRTPIVALTAHDAAEARERCLIVGIDDVLGKPYTIEACANAVRRWIPAVEPQAAAEDAATEAATGPSLVEIDRGVIAGLASLGGGRRTDLYPRLVALFEPASVAALDEFRMHLESGDFVAGATICHRLKSSAANVGALTFASVVRDAEQACLARDASRAADLHARLAAVLPALHAALRAQPDRATA
jgi:signal transduction histidine kinase/ligand-binding sensor domain-containing protein/CheY-like chemotaxis protein/HPt (histidine-containing phosphotransfer) domain-containing protein